MGHFTTPDFQWFYIYFAIITAIFYAIWNFYSPHKWQQWSILGSAFILFITYYQVQVAVAVNNWYRPFYDAIQNALSQESTTTAADLYGYMFSFLILALIFCGTGRRAGHAHGTGRQAAAKAPPSPPKSTSGTSNF